MVRVVERQSYEVYFEASREELATLVYVLRNYAGENPFLKTLMSACSDCVHQDHEFREDACQVS